jgi:hypothetical protein
MGRNRVPGICLMAFALIMILSTAGCFGSNNGSSSATPTVEIPKPHIEGVVAPTSGTQSAYFATLDIKVKNDGAEGTVLVQATVTQAGSSASREMPVFLKQGETHELKLTYPLVWEGGTFTSDVKAIVP